MVDFPEQFDEWPLEAKRVWVSQSLTQREQLHLAAESLDIELEIDQEGPLTNRDLGQFITEVLCQEVAK